MIFYDPDPAFIVLFIKYSPLHKWQNKKGHNVAKISSIWPPLTQICNSAPSKTKNHRKNLFLQKLEEDLYSRGYINRADDGKFYQTSPKEIAA